MPYNNKSNNTEYKPPKVIYEAHRHEGQGKNGSFIGVVEYEMEGKQYRRLAKIALVKGQDGQWGFRKTKGFSLEDFKIVLDKSVDIRDALDGMEPEKAF
jgi:hypothetical protein